jgi:hypothetical protein
MMNMLRQAMNYVNRMGPQEWVLLLAAMIVVGLICMRGYGSRSNY